MDETSSSLKTWVAFAGGVLVIVVLYWAQAVLVPVALAAMLSFVLAPPVTWLERWVGRVPAVLAVVTLVFIVLGVAGWGLARQMNHLSEDLPGYRVNILAKIADVRGAGKGGTVEKLQETIADIKTDLGKSDPATGPKPRAVVVASQPVAGFPAIAWLEPIVGPLGIAALVIALVIFMLLERRDLRDRLIGLVGHGRLTVTTKAFDEAGTRVSRQLLMQSLVNGVYGIVAGFGLYFLGVPYALVWGVLGAALRIHPAREGREAHRNRRTSANHGPHVRNEPQRRTEHAPHQRIGHAQEEQPESHGDAVDAVHQRLHQQLPADARSRLVERLGGHGQPAVTD